MSIQFATLFCLCLALAIPLLVMSTSNQEIEEAMRATLNRAINHHENSNHRGHQLLRTFNLDDDDNSDEHLLLKKAADFEQILKPCNRMPASGRGQEYADCVRNRMLLMGRRKRRNAN